MGSKDPNGDELNFEEEEEECPVPKEIKSYVEADRWRDEDKEEDIKDNWDDDDEEEEVKEDPNPVVVKKKPLKERIAEKEERRRQAEIEAEALANKVKTPEEILAEKLEAQRLQEESDLMLAKETFGVGAPNCLSGVKLVTKDNFEDFKKLLVDKMMSAEKSPLYIGFLETLFRDLCVGLEVDDIKRLSSSLNALYNEKIKALKSAKPKKKALVKSSIKLERNNLQPEYDDDYMNEYEEFL